MKRCTVIIVLKAESSDRLLSKFAKSQLPLIGIQQIAKRKTSNKGPNITRKSKFVRKVQGIIDKNTPDQLMPLLRFSRYSIGRIVHENLRYKSYVMWRGQLCKAKRWPSGSRKALVVNVETSKGWDALIFL